MYLKRLEILGFKSFAIKTSLTFADGLTAIVGPNGCGKTNILDALRWVLGEQKPSLLRGGKMEEVIFNGTSSAKPLGMAEVTLTVVNDRGLLATEYNELQVTRRLYRSGESEYLLNKVPCRLRDITDLFLDTGVGTHSYSVIQPDMIEAVISDRAEERRYLFEEAAGITKYKLRRRAALRKLEATEHDFLRLKDIYAEVKTRANSLYRQHKKAERYQKVVDEIKQWELYLGASRVGALKAEKRTLGRQVEDLSRQKVQCETSLDQHAAQLEAERKEQVDIERRLNEIGREIYTITESAHSFEREISILGEKKTNAERLIEKNESEYEALSKRLESLADQIKAARQEADGLAETLEEKSTGLAQAESEQAEIDRRLLEARSAREGENRRLVELEGRLSSEITEERSLKQQQRELSDRIAEIESQISAREQEQSELVTRLHERRHALDDQIGRKKQVDERRTALTEEMETLAEAGEALSLDMANLNASIEAAQARRKLLEDMMLQHEGYEAGVVSAMDEKDRWPGIAGTVAELFVPAEGMETATEAALGEMARFIVCRDRATAEDIIRFLKDNSKGRVGILVPDTGTITPAVKRPQLDLPGVVGWLDSFVSTEEGMRSLKDAVLSRTIVFGSETSPSEILEHLPYGFTAVSTDGVVYRKNVISGGSDDRFPLFRRREKVQQQEEIVAQLSERLKGISDEKGRTLARLAAARAESNEVGSQLQELSEEIESVQKDVNENDFAHRSLTSEFERLNREKQALSVKLEDIQSRQCSLELDSSKLADQKDHLIGDITAAGNRLEDLERDAAAAVDRVSRHQVAVIETRSRLEQTTSRITHLNELTSSIETGLSTNTTEIEKARTDIRQAQERTGTLERDLEAAFRFREEKSEQQEKFHETQAELLRRVSGHEKDIKRLRDERDVFGERLHELDIRLNTIDAEIRSISERIREDYEVDIHTAAVAKPDDGLADEGAAQHLGELRDRLKKFGAVNLLAIEEYREASEREKFLREQLSDLETAKGDLNSTIAKINQTARRLFNDTLEKVQKNFRELFAELFSGGEAGIRLIEPDDPLESDIEITARPRGKNLLPITMMSGGERALTAIALLFSLYLVKPSPFCILDEIDAPLDDANCHRFLKIIRNFSHQTQFATITHNKITMAASNNLYGVTMEEPGISKLVAVRFSSDDGDEDAVVSVETANDAYPEQLPESIQERIGPEISLTRDEDT
ncbi:MAG TPA: chromosome segregation protein SMC [Acidobacteriota bacterium]|nr:chromosome segregation protein SMC [Acidobacteriota bacterium]